MQQDRSKILLQLELWRDRWKTPPPIKYLSTLADFLISTFESDQISPILNKSVEDYDSVPSISQLLDTASNLSIKKKFQKPYAAPPIEDAWKSARCPGMPASIEALCLLIEQGKTEQTGWRFGLEFTGLTEQKIWEIYELWSVGKKHPMLDDYKENPHMNVDI